MKNNIHYNLMVLILLSIFALKIDADVSQALSVVCNAVKTKFYGATQTLSLTIAELHSQALKIILPRLPMILEEFKNNTLDFKQIILAGDSAKGRKIAIDQMVIETKASLINIKINLNGYDNKSCIESLKNSFNNAIKQSKNCKVLVVIENFDILLNNDTKLIDDIKLLLNDIKNNENILAIFEVEALPSFANEFTDFYTNFYDNFNVHKIILNETNSKQIFNLFLADNLKNNNEFMEFIVNNTKNFELNHLKVHYLELVKRGEQLIKEVADNSGTKFNPPLVEATPLANVADYVEKYLIPNLKRIENELGKLPGAEQAKLMLKLLSGKMGLEKVLGVKIGYEEAKEGLKDILHYDGGNTKLLLRYHQQVDKNTHQPLPNSFVFYAQVRGQENQNAL